MSGHEFQSWFPESGSIDYADDATNLTETTLAEMRQIAARYPQARSALVHRVLSGRAHTLVTELVDALARDTGGRSVTHGVRELLDQAAHLQARYL